MDCLSDILMYVSSWTKSCWDTQVYGQTVHPDLLTAMARNSCLPLCLHWDPLGILRQGATAGLTSSEASEPSTLFADGFTKGANV